MNRFHLVSQDEYLKSVARQQDPLPYEELKLPRRATQGSAGYDLFMPFRAELQPGDVLLVPTGICVELDMDKVCLIFPRSGLGFKHQMVLANTVGVIDADYYRNPNNGGHIFVKVVNQGDHAFVLEKGGAFCQAVLLPFIKTDDDSCEKKRTGGMGSTDAQLSRSRD